jgi:hypothetical protein
METGAMSVCEGAPHYEQDHDEHDQKEEKEGARALVVVTDMDVFLMANIRESSWKIVGGTWRSP